MEANIYGNQCGSDNAFTRKARLLQSMYRVEIGEAGGALCDAGDYYIIFVK